MTTGRYSGLKAAIDEPPASSLPPLIDGGWMVRPTDPRAPVVGREIAETWDTCGPHWRFYAATTLSLYTMVETAVRIAIDEFDRSGGPRTREYVLRRRGIEPGSRADYTRYQWADGGFEASQDLPFPELALAARLRVSDLRVALLTGPPQPLSARTRPERHCLPDPEESRWSELADERLLVRHALWQLGRLAARIRDLASETDDPLALEPFRSLGSDGLEGCHYTVDLCARSALASADVYTRDDPAWRLAAARFFGAWALSCANRCAFIQ